MRTRGRVFYTTKHIYDISYTTCKYISSACDMNHVYCSLGMVSILLHKMHVCRQLVSTDGDDDTVDLLRRNVNECDATAISVSKLWWGQWEEFTTLHPSKFDVLCAADVIYEREQIEPLMSTVAQIMKS